MIHSETGREIKNDAIQRLIASNWISHKKQNIAEILNDLFINQLETVKISIFWLPPYPYTNRMFSTQV